MHALFRSVGGRVATSIGEGDVGDRRNAMLVVGGASCVYVDSRMRVRINTCSNPWQLIILIHGTPAFVFKFELKNPIGLRLDRERAPK